RFTGFAPLNCSSRKARTSTRSDSASGGRSRRAKWKVGMHGIRARGRGARNRATLRALPRGDAIRLAALSAVAVVLTLAAVAPAGAQTPPAEIPRLPPVVVTPSRIEERASETPASVTVIPG